MLVPGSHSWLLMSRTSSPGGSDVTVPLSVLPSVSRPPSFPLSPSTHTRCHPLALAIPPSNPHGPHGHLLDNGGHGVSYWIDLLSPLQPRPLAPEGDKEVGSGLGVRARGNTMGLGPGFPGHSSVESLGEGERVSGGGVSRVRGQVSLWHTRPNDPPGPQPLYVRRFPTLREEASVFVPIDSRRQGHRPGTGQGCGCSTPDAESPS